MTPNLPPIDWYRDPGLDQLTPLTVDDDGRVFGHVAGWDTAHVSFPGQRLLPPRSRSDYAYFMTGAMRVMDGSEQREISVGRLIMGCPHAGPSLNQQATSDFYADSGAVAATVCAGEDRYGIWVAGAVEPDLDELGLRRFRSCGLSGDWRNVNGHLELVGAISVGVQGFPIPRSRVASGAPVSLVAAGALAPPAAFGRAVDPAWEAAVPIESVTVGKLTSGTTGARVEIAADGPVRFFGADGAQTHPSPADFADLIAARLDERKAAAELSAAHTALLSELDDTPAVVASLLDEVDDTGTVVASLLAEVDDTPQEVGALLASLDDEDDDEMETVDDQTAAEALGVLDKSPRENWIDKLPGPLKAAWNKSIIYRAAVHMHQERGMPVGVAIASAINWAKHICATGDVKQWKGPQSVNPKSRAECCGAVATWEAMKASTKGD